MLYGLILILMLVAVTMLAKRSNLLRDVITDRNRFEARAAETPGLTPKAPYSLGRSQLTLWTIIIIGSYIFLYLENGYVPPHLDEVNLILLSISIGTTVVAQVIDGTQTGPRHQDTPSQGFITDILSDEKGISIHRLQQVIWTIIVAVIYIKFVAANTRLPDETVITTQLLELMGISAGAYVGLKATENMKQAAEQPAAKPVEASSQEAVPIEDAEAQPVG